MKNAQLLKTRLLDYQQAWDWQRQLHSERRFGAIPDTLILTEHPHTIGKSGDESHLVADEARLATAGMKLHAAGGFLPVCLSNIFTGQGVQCQ